MDDTSTKFDFVRNSLSTPSTDISLMQSESLELLKSLEEKASEKILEENLDTAVVILKRAEAILENLTTKGDKVESALIFSILYNLAYCYQHKMNFENCSVYLDACLYNINLLKQGHEEVVLRLNEIKQTSFAAKLNIQLCAVLSNMGNHRKALSKAKAALRLSIKSIKLAVSASKHKKLKESIRKLGSSYKRLIGIELVLSGSKPMLNKIERYFKGIQTVEYLSNYPSWLSQVSLNSFTVMKPTFLKELTDCDHLEYEFSVDFLYYKILLLGISYFCISSEINHLKQNKFHKENTEIKKFHVKAINVLKEFVPLNCPLLSYIIESYNFRFENQKDSTPKVLKFRKVSPKPPTRVSRAPSVSPRPPSMSPSRKNRLHRRSSRPKSSLSKPFGRKSIQSFDLDSIYLK